MVYRNWYTGKGSVEASYNMQSSDGYQTKNTTGSLSTNNRTIYQVHACCLRNVFAEDKRDIYKQLSNHYETILQYSQVPVIINELSYH